MRKIWTDIHVMTDIDWHLRLFSYCPPYALSVWC